MSAERALFHKMDRDGIKTLCGRFLWGWRVFASIDWKRVDCPDCLRARA